MPPEPSAGSLQNPKKILVTGGKPSELARHLPTSEDQFVFWGATDRRIYKKQVIPIDVAVIFLTRFLSHPMCYHIERLARERGEVVLVDGTRFTRGTIARALAYALDAIRFVQAEVLEPISKIAFEPF